MSNANITYSATNGYNGGWTGWGHNAAYAGNNSGSNFACAIRFTTPAFAGAASSITFSVPAIRGYTNSTATLYLSVTKTDPTSTDAYSGDAPGTDSGRVALSAYTFSSLTASVQYYNFTLDVSSLSPSSTYYLVLSADRPAGESSNYIQVYTPGNMSGYVTYTESASTFKANVSSQELGKAVTFTITRANSAYTHRLYYRFNSTGSWTRFATDVATTCAYTFPLSLAESIPAATSGVWEIRCNTYNGDTLIGYTTMTITLKVPSSVVPSIGTFTRTMETDNTTVSGWGIFVQSISKLKVQLNATASYSTIKSWSIAYADGTWSGTNSAASLAVTRTSDALATAGSNMSITATVTDARGRTAKKTITYTVQAYSNPTATNVSVYRSTNNGTKSDSGTYIAVTATSSFSSCGGKNSLVAFTVSWKARSASSYGTAQNLTSGTRKLISGASIITSYNVRITVQDQLNTTYIDSIIPTQTATFNAKPGGLGVAFGKFAETDYRVELAEGWDITFGAETFREHTQKSSYGYGQKTVAENDDLDDYVEPGVYRISSGTIAKTLAHCPYTAANCRLEVLSSGNTSNDYIMQVLRSSYTTDVYYRHKHRTWSDWRILVSVDAASPAIENSNIDVSKLFYTPPTTVSLTGIQCFGFLTGGAKVARVVFKPPKLLTLCSGVTVTEVTGGSFRTVGGGYIGASNADFALYIDASGIRGGDIYVELKNDQGWGYTNNTPICGQGNFKFTLS